MSEITLEQTHALLEKLAEYVMTEVPTRGEMNERFEQVDKRFEQIDRRFEQIDKRFEQIDERFEQIDKRFEQIDERFAQIEQRFEFVEKDIVIIRSQEELIRAEQGIFAKTFELHHKRLRYLEDNAAAFHIRDDGEMDNYKIQED